MKLETATKILHISVERDELSEYYRVITKVIDFFKGRDGLKEDIEILQKISQDFNKILTNAMD